MEWKAILLYVLFQQDVNLTADDGGGTVVSVVVEIVLKELEVGDVLEDLLKVVLTDILGEVAEPLVEGNDLVIIKVDVSDNNHRSGVVVAGIAMRVIVLNVEEERNIERKGSSREGIFSNRQLQRKERCAIYRIPSINHLVLVCTPTVNNNIVLVSRVKVEAENNKDNGTNDNDGSNDTNDNSENTALVNVN